jgi:very-short-patch-repair endonuclease
MVRYRPPIGSTPRIRSLRRKRTRAEQAMLRLLRSCFPDDHWRFQVPIRDFTADFASNRRKLVVEVDGGQHGGAADDWRTGLIEAEGYRVLRFWSVARAVEAARMSESAPTLALPHKGGGNQSEPHPWRV